MSPNYYYKLNDKKEVVPATREDYTTMFEESSQVLFRTILGSENEILISTIFLGTEHLGGMFETMIFGIDNDEYQERCTTYEEAFEQHNRAINHVCLKLDLTPKEYLQSLIKLQNE